MKWPKCLIKAAIPRHLTGNLTNEAPAGERQGLAINGEWHDSAVGSAPGLQIIKGTQGNPPLPPRLAVRCGESLSERAVSLSARGCRLQTRNAARRATGALLLTRFNLFNRFSRTSYCRFGSSKPGSGSACYPSSSRSLAVAWLLPD